MCMTECHLMNPYLSLNLCFRDNIVKNKNSGLLEGQV